MMQRSYFYLAFDRRTELHILRIFCRQIFFFCLTLWIYYNLVIDNSLSSNRKPLLLDIYKMKQCLQCSNSIALTPCSQPNHLKFNYQRPVGHIAHLQYVQPMNTFVQNYDYTIKLIKNEKNTAFFSRSKQSLSVKG